MSIILALPHKMLRINNYCSITNHQKQWLWTIATVYFYSQICNLGKAQQGKLISAPHSMAVGGAAQLRAGWSAYKMACSLGWQVGANCWLGGASVLLHVAYTFSHHTGWVLTGCISREGARWKRYPLFWLKLWRSHSITFAILYQSGNGHKAQMRKRCRLCLLLREWWRSRRVWGRGSIVVVIWGTYNLPQPVPLNLVFLTGNLYLTKEWLECPASLWLGKTALSNDLG